MILTREKKTTNRLAEKRRKVNSIDSMKEFANWYIKEKSIEGRLINND